MSFNPLLARLPLIKNDQLKAWDAADEYLVSHFANTSGTSLIINDNFGALACNLPQLKSQLWSDSYISQISSDYNLKQNDLPEGNFIPATQCPQGSFDQVIMRLPKSLELLEQQLYQLRQHINENTLVVAAGMVKHWPKQARTLFEKYIGTTDLSLTKKKARLLFAKVELPNCQPPRLKGYQVQENGLQMSADANVFSQHRQDPASHLMLTNLQKVADKSHYLDLGCGNGIIGCSLLKDKPDAKITFVDESFQAVNCSKNNLALNNLAGTNSQFLVDDCLTGQPENSVDLILCNPPFHQQHSIGDHIAWRMFKQAKDCLTNDGEIWVIGNRHLAYHTKLNKIFGNCETIDADNKFVLLKAKKRRT